MKAVCSLFIILLCGFQLKSKSNFILTTMSPDKSDSTVVWTSRTKLVWTDFRGTPDSLNAYKAMTYVNVSAKNIFTSPEKIDFKIVCFFKRYRSWSKLKDSESLLKHEQLHFDIAELITRKIRKGYATHISKDINETAIHIKSVFDKYYNQELDSLNAEYDAQTNHGTIPNVQKEWESKIVKELKKLEAYANTRVTILRVKK